MLFALESLSFLMAQAPSAPEQTPGSPLGGLLNIAPFIVIGILFWFFLLRPMKRQEAERQALLSTLKKNDRVVTSGGLIGVVANVKEKEDEVTLKVDDSSNFRLRVTRSSIVKILNGEDPAVKEQKTGGA
jgi:preprotein translocase subunit YajC